MSHYSIQIHARPQLRYASLLGRASTLGQAVAPLLDTKGNVNSQLASAGGETMQLALSRSDRDEVFNEVAAAVQQLGYSVVEAEISEIVAKTVEGAVCGFLGAGALTSMTKNPYVTLLAAFSGAAAGAKAGSLVRVVSARHRYQWFPAPGWVVTELPVEAAAQQPVPAEIQTSPLFPA